MDIFDLIFPTNSLPPKCNNGQPYPSCGGGSPYTGRGVTVNPTTCQCVPFCPSGKYYLGGSQCGTKAQQDAANAANQTVLNCINGGGTWSYSDNRCLSGGTGGGYNVNVDSLMQYIPYIVGGLIILVLISR